jgi:hypothetical protein
MHSTIVGVNDRALGADGPTFNSIHKPDVVQIDANACILQLPGTPAVDCSIDGSSATDGPPQAIVDK